MPKLIRSPRYPGWSITKVSATEFFMVRDAGTYAIRVTPDPLGGWTGELMNNSGRGWKPARLPYTHCVLGVYVEAERRARTIKIYERKALTGARS